MTLIYSCAKKESATETVGTIKKKTYEPNVLKRIEKARDEGGGIFNSNRNKSTTYEFATSNVLWRASLETLDFIPLNNVDYSGGVIVTDWYSGQASKDSIKITVRFLSNEVQASSIKVINHKKICDSQNVCKIIKGNENFNSKIKNNILQTARKIKIEDEEKKLKK
jgi:hypothetical protein